MPVESFKHCSKGEVPVMANDEFTVYIYGNEYAYLKWLVQQMPFIETGGDLFGVWQNEVCAVVQFVLGPGRQCQRTTTSFYQDVSYLDRVGRHLTSNEGICNIGEWHSHHHIGLPYPSAGDQNTVWSHMSGERFLVFIASFSTFNSVDVGCFMFNSNTGKMTKGKMEMLINCSPLRHAFAQRGIFKLEAEQGQDWDTFCKSRLETRWWRPGARAANLEFGESHCVCEIVEEDCCDGIARIISRICQCLRSAFFACCRCIRSAFFACCRCIRSVFFACCRCIRSAFFACCRCSIRSVFFACFRGIRSAFFACCRCIRSGFFACCRCIRSAFFACCRGIRWCFRCCVAGLMNFYTSCARQPARD